MSHFDPMITGFGLGVAISIVKTIVDNIRMKNREKQEHKSNEDI